MRRVTSYDLRVTSGGPSAPVANRQASIANRQSPSGFTLTELMVAVVVLIVVIIATSKIFGTAGQITGTGQAIASVMQEAAAIEQQVRDDIAKLTAEGFFAIRCVAVRNNVNAPAGPLLNPNLPANAWIRADQLVFFTDGVQSPQTFRFNQETNRKGQGTAARIYYGHTYQILEGRPYEGNNNSGYAHDASPGVTVFPWRGPGSLSMVQTLFRPMTAGADDDAVDIYSFQNGGTVNGAQPPATKWLLARQCVTLLDDDSNPSNTNAKTEYLSQIPTARSIFFANPAHPIFGHTREIRNGRLDAAASSLRDIRDHITVLNQSTGAPRTWNQTPAGTNQRAVIGGHVSAPAPQGVAIYYPRAERHAPSMHRVDQALTNSVISSACSSFIVDWTYYDGVGHIDANRDGVIDLTGGIDYGGVVMPLWDQQQWFGMPALVGPTGAQPPASFGWADLKRGTLPFADWWQTPPNPQSFFASNIDKPPTQWNGGNVVPGDAVIKYEAFFGYNQHEPYMMTSTPVTPHAYLGAPAPHVGYTPFPSAIRITMTLHDPEGKLEHGREFQFVIDLPESR